MTHIRGFIPGGRYEIGEDGGQDNENYEKPLFPNKKYLSEMTLGKKKIPVIVKPKKNLKSRL